MTPQPIRTLRKKPGMIILAWSAITQHLFLCQFNPNRGGVWDRYPRDAMYRGSQAVHNQPTHYLCVVDVENLPRE